MYPIPRDVFSQRLRKWHHTTPRRKVETRDAQGRKIIEYWSLGVCRLRVVYHRDGAELLADRGIPTAQRRGHAQPIAFGYWDEP